MSSRSEAHDGAAAPPVFGFVGLGNIGLPMAERLVASGHPTVVFDVRGDASARLAALGARAAASCADLAERSDLIGVCVRDDAQARDVMLAGDGLLAGARPGAVIALHSTLLPRTVLELAPACEARGVFLIDAAVTGGAAGAAAGTLCTMVGGEPAAIERYRPAAACFSGKIVHTGPLGSGAATKLCNNLLLYMGYLAAAEATALADAAGLSRDALLEVTGASGVATEPMRRFLPTRDRALGAPDDPELRERLTPFAELAAKDLAQAIELGREHGLDLPGAALCRQLAAEMYGIGARGKGASDE